jgi:hypothetical protein
MTKARDLADLVATGSVLSDGAIATTEITGVTASSAEINNMSGISSNVQQQINSLEDENLLQLGV